MKTILLAHVARGLFAMPVMSNAFTGRRHNLGFPQIAFEAPNDQGNKSVAQLATEIKGEFAKSLDAVKAIAEEAIGKANKGEELSTSIKEKADEALTKMNTFSEQLSDIEQKLARTGGSDREEEKTFGQRFVETEELKALASAPRNGAAANLPIKADITTATTNAAGSAGAGIVPNRLPVVVGLPQQRLTVRALLSPGRTDGPLIQYLQETGLANFS